MASAWGDSWGSAWGDSWGAIAVAEAPAVSGGIQGIGTESAYEQFQRADRARQLRGPEPARPIAVVLTVAAELPAVEVTCRLLVENPPEPAVDTESEDMGLILALAE